MRPQQPRFSNNNTTKIMLTRKPKKKIQIEENKKEIA
jgi:hypothetical protein